MTSFTSLEERCGFEFLVYECRILARHRHHPFFHLTDLNQKIFELRDRLNSRSFQKNSGSRKERFLQFEQPTLRPLPVTPYEYLRMMVATVPPDYYVVVNGHFYSVPHPLVGKPVDILGVSSDHRNPLWRMPGGFPGAPTRFVDFPRQYPGEILLFNERRMNHAVSSYS